MTHRPLVFPSPHGPCLAEDLRRFGFAEVGRKTGGGLTHPLVLFWHPRGVLIETGEGEKSGGRLYATLAVCGPSSQDCSAFLKALSGDEAYFICPRADGTLRAVARPVFGPEGPWFALAKLQELGRLCDAEDDGPAGWRHAAATGGFNWERHEGVQTAWGQGAPDFLLGAPPDHLDPSAITEGELVWSERVERHAGVHQYVAPLLAGEPEGSAWRQRATDWERSLLDPLLWKRVRADAFSVPTGPNGVCLPAGLLMANHYDQEGENALDRAGGLLDEAPKAALRAWAHTEDGQGMTLGLYLLKAVLHNGDHADAILSAAKTLVTRSEGWAPWSTERQQPLGLFFTHHRAHARNGLPWWREPRSYAPFLRVLDELGRMGVDWGRHRPFSWRESIRKAPWWVNHRVERMTAAALSEAYGRDLIATSPAFQRFVAQIEAEELGGSLKPPEGASPKARTQRL